MGLSDTDITKNIFRIGESRQRSIYYRPDGTPTKPLPSDLEGQLHYLGKGFTLNKKGSTPNRCPYCEFVAQNALGLRTHLNKHVAESKIEEESK